MATGIVFTDQAAFSIGGIAAIAEIDDAEGAGIRPLSLFFVSIVSFVSESCRNGIERGPEASNSQILREDPEILL